MNHTQDMFLIISFLHSTLFIVEISTAKVAEQ